VARNKDNIKVVAPANSPHICYIPRGYEKTVAFVKRKTGMSMYRIICASAGFSLSDKGKIQEFKRTLRQLGYKTIGDWVTRMLDIICETEDYRNIPKPIKKEF
jgi:hypothetical protein